MSDQSLSCVAIGCGVRHRILRAIHRTYSILGVVLLSALLARAAIAQEEPQTIYWAGLSFVGNASDIQQTNPYLSKVVDEVGLGNLNKLLWAQLQSANRPDINLVTELGRSTSGNAVAMTLALDFESVQVYPFGDEKICAYVQVFAQIMTFDMTDKRLISAFPVNSKKILDCVSGAGFVSDIQGQEWVTNALMGDGESLVNLVPSKLESLPLNSGWALDIQVAEIKLGPTVLTEISQVGMTEGAYRRWLAAQLSATMSSQIKIPVLPYTLGQAIGGALPMRFSDAGAFDIVLPPADFTVDITSRGYVKRHLGSNDYAAKEQFIFGMGLAFNDRGFGLTLFEENLQKQSEYMVKIGLGSEVPDWERYERSTISLMQDFFRQFPDPDKKWVSEHVPDLKKKKTSWGKLRESFEKLEADVFEEMRGS